MVVDDAWMWSPYKWVDRTGDFETGKLFAYPTPLTEVDPGGRRKKICVIGGGIAGLSAAYELARRGHNVTVLEASARWGGRIFTRYFSGGTYGEFGAMRIPPDHKCVDHYVAEFRLDSKRRKFVSSNSKGLAFFRGVPSTIRKWRPIAQAYNLRQSRQVKPDDLLTEVLEGFPAGFWETFGNTLTDEELIRFDNMTLCEAICGPMARFKLSAEEWEYAGGMTHAIWLDRFSLLHNLRELAVLGAPGKYEIVGGMEELVKAFVEQLSSMQANVNLHLHEPVVRVEVNGSVRVTSQNAKSGSRSSEFEHVICSAPAPATMRIDFGRAMPPRKLEALRGLSYVAAAKTLMKCRQRHWEFHDGIYGGSSITDLPIQQCWYPSDNSEEIPDDPSEDKTFAVDLPALGLAPRRAKEPENWKALDVQRSYSPGVFVAAYLWESNARRFAALNEADRTELAIASVAKLHPKNELYLDEVVHHCWDVGGGAFAFFGPGEQGRYQALLCQPLFADSGEPKVFFAGEHLAITHGWIQGAIQSALACVIEIIKL